MAVVTGNEFPNTLNGTPDDDTLNGLGGQDQLNGSAGADLMDGGDDEDTVDPYGGDGGDIVDYFTSPFAVMVNLGANTASGGDAEGDTLVGIDQVWGSQFNDVIYGNDGANVLEGSGGDDSLYGAGGDDYFTGQPGADFMDGGAGIDEVQYFSENSALNVNLELGTISGGVNAT